MKMSEKEYRVMDDYAKANYLEDILRDELGEDELCIALLRALSCDDIIDNLEYIARMYEIELTEEQDDE